MKNWKSLLGLASFAAMIPLSGCVAQTGEEGEGADQAAAEDTHEASQAIAVLICWYNASNQLTCEGPGSGGTWAYGFYPTPGYQFPAYTSGNQVNWSNCQKPVWAVTNTIKVQYWSDTGYYGETTQYCGY